MVIGIICCKCVCDVYIDVLVSLQVVDPNTNIPLGPGKQGEILIRTQSMFKCYIGRPDLTSEALTHDGYLKTGITL